MSQSIRARTVTATPAEQAVHTQTINHRPRAWVDAHRGDAPG